MAISKQCYLLQAVFVAAVMAVFPKAVVNQKAIDGNPYVVDAYSVMGTFGTDRINIYLYKNSKGNKLTVEGTTTEQDDMLISKIRELANQ